MHRNVFEAWEKARVKASEVRGGMVWKTVKGALDRLSLAEHFVVVDMQARYAYEVAAGVRLEEAALATTRYGSPTMRTILGRSGRSSDVLLSAPAFSVPIASTTGKTARMRTVAPDTFVKFKLWMADQRDRDPLKVPRDKLQASIVERLVGAPARSTANSDVAWSIPWLRDLGDKDSSSVPLDKSARG